MHSPFTLQYVTASTSSGGPQSKKLRMDNMTNFSLVEDDDAANLADHFYTNLMPEDFVVFQDLDPNANLAEDSPLTFAQFDFMSRPVGNMQPALTFPQRANDFAAAFQPSVQALKQVATLKAQAMVEKQQQQQQKPTYPTHLLSPLSQMTPNRRKSERATKVVRLPAMYTHDESEDSSSEESCQPRSTGPKHSRFLGVSFDKRKGKWKARLMYEGKRYFLGLHTTEVEAAKAYDQKVFEIRGNVAKVNFPPSFGQI
jgi:AP2 domain